MTEIKPFAFVLMPFSETLDDVYQIGIKEAADRLGIVAERVDEQHFSETILNRIYRQIEQSDFVIAEMTDRNPNVFYEVGYAHAKKKKCILLSSNADSIPFDLKHHPHIIYNGSAGDLRDRIAPRMQWTISEIRKMKEKSISVSLNKPSGELKKTDWDHTGTFELRITLKNNSQSKSPEIEAIYLEMREGWKLTTRGEECASDSNRSDGTARYLIPPPIKRLSPGAFAESKIQFRRRLWDKFSGESDPKDEYALKGNLKIDIVTEEGIFKESLDLEDLIDEYPF